MAESNPDTRKITVEKHDHLLFVGLNRPAKRNALTAEMLEQLAAAFTEADDDTDVRCILLFAHGDHFSAGMDLMDVVPQFIESSQLIPDGNVDPWGVQGRLRKKPLVTAVQGTCWTAGLELVLASDIAIAANNTRFAQAEVSRGIMPAGGSTFRFVLSAGWSSAMRYILTGDEFDAAEARRLRLVQEVVPVGKQFERAEGFARRIATQAPLAVQASLLNAQTALHGGIPSAIEQIVPVSLKLAHSEDVAEGMMAAFERRPAQFSGR